MGKRLCLLALTSLVNRTRGGRMLQVASKEEKPRNDPVVSRTTKALIAFSAAQRSFRYEWNISRKLMTHVIFL